MKSDSRRNTIKKIKYMDDLKERLYSSDQDISGLALAELIRRGKTATPILLEALTAQDPRTRRLAAEGLGEIADHAAADSLFQATKDVNPEVRARAATALHKLGDPRSLKALVSTMNDYPDILHSPYTASMYPLMQGGKEVLSLVIPFLREPVTLTRQRAFLIVKAVASRIQQGQKWDQLWRALGSYDPDGPPAARDQATQKWQEWLANL